ncbi:feather keratin 4-like [Phasianus colchicus]|nr:feather keratin 4-like [Phasianus colchicus]
MALILLPLTIWACPSTATYAWVASGPEAVLLGIKASPAPGSLIHFSCLLLLGDQVHLHPTAMSCYDLCRPCGPTPLANSCNEPCVRQCQDSRVVIQPSPVVVTLPGPILSSFPQNTAVGSSASAAVGSILSEEGVPISSGGFGISGLGSRFSGRRCLPY